MKTETIEGVVRCKAFSHEGVRENKVMIENETVWVWDSVAKHYTRCHCLSKATQNRIRKMLAN